MGRHLPKGREEAVQSALSPYKEHYVLCCWAFVKAMEGTLFSTTGIPCAVLTVGTVQASCSETSLFNFSRPHSTKHWLRAGLLTLRQTCSATCHPSSTQQTRSGPRPALRTTPVCAVWQLHRANPSCFVAEAPLHKRFFLLYLDWNSITHRKLLKLLTFFSSW